MFRCGVKIVRTVEEPQYVKLACINCSLEKIGRNSGLQPELLIGEIDHSVTKKSYFADLGHIWESYPSLDVVCLAFINARLSMEIQNMSGLGIKDCLVEACLGWK